jgi:MATE family multidrug resistance protein
MLDTRRDENWTPTPMSAIRQAGRELRGTLQLATPIIVGHLGQNLMGVADSVMIGHVGTVPLAASAFAGALFGMMFVISIGVLSSVAVRTAMAFGAGRTHECSEIVRHGLAIATALSLFFVACVALLMDELHRFGQPADVLVEARPYMWIITWSLLPTLAYQVLRQFYEAVSSVRFSRLPAGGRCLASRVRSRTPNGMSRARL